MTSVAELQTQISDHRDTLKKHTERSERLTRGVEKEQPHLARLVDRLQDGSSGGAPGCRKISLTISHNIRYKERRIKRFSDELAVHDSEIQTATKKLTDLEAISTEIQAQIASAEAAGTLPE